MFNQLKSDIASIMARDPAARSAIEVLLCYPGLRAVRRHRRAHKLWLNNHKLLARLVSQRTRRITGIEIHPGAKLGSGILIDHGMGVVIGETAEVGDNVTIYQNVTLGGTGKDCGKRHPTIGNNVVIGAGARVLGPFTVGDDAKIGASAVVLKEVPPGATVVGNPGRVVKPKEPKKEQIDLDQVHLPDPIKEQLQRIGRRVEQLESCIKRNSNPDICACCCDAETEFCLQIIREECVSADL